jgi:hypothetical protein
LKPRNRSAPFKELEEEIMFQAVEIPKLFPLPRTRERTEEGLNGAKLFPLYGSP